MGFRPALPGSNKRWPRALLLRRRPRRQLPHRPQLRQRPHPLRPSRSPTPPEAQALRRFRLRPLRLQPPSLRPTVPARRQWPEQRLRQNSVAPVPHRHRHRLRLPPRQLPRHRLHRSTRRWLLHPQRLLHRSSRLPSHQQPSKQPPRLLRHLLLRPLPKPPLLPKSSATARRCPTNHLATTPKKPPLRHPNLRHPQLALVGLFPHQPTSPPFGKRAFCRRCRAGLARDLVSPSSCRATALKCW